MNLVKEYNKNNTIYLTLVGPNGEEFQKVEEVPLEGSKGILVVTVDEFITYEQAEFVRRELTRALSSSSDGLVSVLIPSNIKIDYIKF